MPPEATRIQRALTAYFIQKRWINAPAIWLKAESASANPDDAVKESHKLNTVLDDWLSPDEDRNLAVRLVDGFVELQIVSPDDVWIQSFFTACQSLKIDARAAFGGFGKPITSILFHAAEPERWGDRWPRGHRDKAGQFVETIVSFSSPPTKTSRAAFVNSRPLPGSRFAGDLVVWRPLGKPPAEDGELGIEDFEPRMLAATSMESICRAVAFATLAYWIRVYLDGLTEWDQTLTRTLGGWVARQVREGQDINARGKSLEGVCWAPIDSSDTAMELLTFMGKLGAKNDLGVFFLHAENALDRNQPVPGWPAIETLFGPHARVGIRRAFRAGLDIELIEEMSQRYVLDTSEHAYVDRDALLKGNPYFHKMDDLVRQWDNEVIFAGAKPQNPFRLYARSSLRTDVARQDFFPGSEAGGILRFSPVHGLVNSDERKADEYLVLNNFEGFHIKPIATVDAIVMHEVNTVLDRMLGLLTQDNAAQMKWLKQFVAWIVQHPEIKAQVCPIIVGGQGIGKSMFGQDLMRALFGSMAGAADAGSLADNKFMITPFIRKLITFIDEVHLENAMAINQIKKIVRSDYVSGQNKFQNQRDHYIPSRLLIASNHVDIGLRSEDADDRCFFFIIAYNAENQKMIAPEFQAWARDLKPFFDRLAGYLKNVIFRQHLVRFFMDVEVTRAELEDLTHSSRNDEGVVRATMSKEREVARAIAADARVLQGMDITNWFNTQQLREAIRRHEGPRTKVEASQVIIEYERAGVLEKKLGDNYMFKYRYHTLLEKLGEAHSLPIPPNWRFEPDDYGLNDVLSVEGGRAWRGNRQGKGQGWQQRRDPDYMAPE
jgi:hypothetical protein